MTIEEEIADEIAGIVTGEGYYATTIGIDAAREAVEAIAPLLNRVRAEGAAEALDSAAGHINRDFQHLPSWDAAWKAGGRTRDWEIGCTRTLIDTVDWLRARAASVRADAIERNSEGNET